MYQIQPIIVGRKINTQKIYILLVSHNPFIFKHYRFVVNLDTQIDNKLL